MTFKVSSLSSRTSIDRSSLLLDDVLDLVHSKKWDTSKDLYQKVLTKSRSIMNRYTVKSVLIFVILKILKIIREECSRVLCGNPELEANTTNLLFAKAEAEIEEVGREDLKDFLIEELEVFASELNEADSLIKESGLRHINDSDVIMTYGYSETVFSFLSFVAEKRRTFSVVVVEGCPSIGGVLMAEKLSAVGVPVTLIPEVCSVALMPKVDKVVIDCDIVFMDGVISCRTGLERICIDASVHSVPVLVCTPVSRVSPQLSITCSKFDLVDNDGGDSNSYSGDHVPAKFISTFVTNIGDLHPSQIMAVARNSFCSEDLTALFANRS